MDPTRADRAAAARVSVQAPVAASVADVPVAVGDSVAAGQTLAILEAMKMEHPVCAEVGGRVVEVPIRPGAQVREGEVLVVLEPAHHPAAPVRAEVRAGADALRPDLQKVIDRTARTLDAARPEAVARRHARGLRTARENVADLCDPGSFVEYGALAVAACIS